MEKKFKDIQAKVSEIIEFPLLHMSANFNDIVELLRQLPNSAIRYERAHADAFPKDVKEYNIAECVTAVFPFFCFLFGEQINEIFGKAALFFTILFSSACLFHFFYVSGRIYNRDKRGVAISACDQVLNEREHSHRKKKKKKDGQKS